MTEHVPDEGGEMSLVMPFVVVTSKGCPYDDQSYSAGWEAGAWDQRFRKVAAFLALEPGKWTPPLPVRTANVPQLDLIAMHHGLVLSSAPCDDTPEWSWITVEGAS